MRLGLCVLAALFVGASPAAAEVLADPTRPTSAAEPETFEIQRGPVLQSTFVGPGTKRAVISGKTYVVGDRVGGAMIADIRPQEVILREGGRERRLRLYPPLAKEVQPPARRSDHPGSATP